MTRQSEAEYLAVDVLDAGDDREIGPPRVVGIVFEKVGRVVVEPAPLLEESSSEEIFSDEEQQDKEDVSSGW